MTATSHALIGTVIAAKIGNPALAIPLALASHVISDMIPHWDTATNIEKKGKKRVIIDSFFDVIIGFILSFLIVIFLFPQTNLGYVFVIILASQALDWLIVPYYLFDINLPLSKAVYKFQKSFDNSLDKPWGIVTQVATVIAVILLGIS